MIRSWFACRGCLLLLLLLLLLFSSRPKVSAQFQRTTTTRKFPHETISRLLGSSGGATRRGRRRLHASSTSSSSPLSSSWSTISNLVGGAYDGGPPYMNYNDAKSDSSARFYKPDERLLSSRHRPNSQTSTTSKLVVLNILTYAAQVFYKPLTPWGINSPNMIDKGQIHRFISPVFLHANPMHLAMNMFSLNQVGNEAEALFGQGRYIATYLASGIVGNIATYRATPNQSLGASGAVLGMVGARYVFMERNGWLLGRGGRNASQESSSLLLFNLLLGWFVPALDNWAHAGGIVGGAAMAYYFGPKIYVTTLPNSGGVRTLVDRPIVRLPRSLESLPESISRVMTSWSGAVSSHSGHGIDSSSKPWKQKTQYERRLKRDLPKRSIKPRFR